MKNLIAILLSLMTASCVMSPIYDGKGSYSGSQFFLQQAPRHTLDFFLDNLAEQLLETNNYLTSRTPVAIVSFVDVERMNETNWLGNSVTEGMIYQMQKRGFTIVDFKTTDFIRVTETGVFVLTRDWKELIHQQQIDYVLTGTMLRQSAGVLMNARIIGMRSRIVVASAQGFLPSEHVGRDIDTLRRIRKQDGVIIRGDDIEANSDTVILKP